MKYVGEASLSSNSKDNSKLGIIGLTAIGVKAGKCCNFSVDVLCIGPHCNVRDRFELSGELIGESGREWTRTKP